MQKEYIKLDDNRIQIKEIIEKQVITDYTYNDLQLKIDELKKQKEEYILKKDAEIKEIEDILLEADNLGIVPIVNLTGEVI